MIVGGDNISNDVVTVGACFYGVVYIRADWRKFWKLRRNADSGKNRKLHGSEA